MVRGTQIGRNVILNWIAVAISLVVAFLLSPFVVHRLGNVGYGVWTLVLSLVSYMGLLDLGLRGAVIRFVGQGYAQGNHQESSRAVSAGLWLRVWISLVILVLSLILASLASRMFRIPPELAGPARWAIVVTGASLAVTLTCGVFGGVLAALHRFDVASTVTIFQTLLRAVGVVWVLSAGYGIVALALWELTVVVAANAALTLLCFRMYPQLRVFFRRPQADILAKLGGYSLYVCLINLCVQFVYYTDNLVVGAFLSASAVTFFAIGGGLLEYLRQIVSSLTTTFMPMASSFEAQGEQKKLHQLLIQGTRVTLLVALPISVALFFRGPTFIGLWMGTEYAQVSGRLLQILLVAQIFAIANHASGNIAYGLGKHRPIAIWASAEAVANLALSILLVRRIGLEGVAWGTVVPSLITGLLLWPRYICKILDVPVRVYLWQSWIRPGLAAVPFAVGCYLADRFWVVTTLPHLFLQIAAIVPLFPLGIALCFWKDVTQLLRSRTRWFAGESAGASTISGEPEQARYLR